MPLGEAKCVLASETESRNRLTDLEDELTVPGRGRRVVGGRWGASYRVWDGQVHTALFKMDNQGRTVWHRELCSVFCGSLDGRGV